MKDIFNRRQRFSLRKYSVGVCSVLLGTALFVAGAPSASAEEVTATPESSTETAATETASSTEEVATETTTTESSNYEAPAPLVATSEPVTTASSEKAEATTETSKASEEEKKTEEASKEEKKTEDKKSEDKKSEDKKSEDKKSSTEAKTEKATTSATSEATTEATSSSEATETETTSLAANPAVQPLNASANKPVADSAATTSATTLSAASTETATAGALETSRSRRRSRRSATDPVSTEYTEGATNATPTMSDPNGASLKNRPLVVPTPKDPGTHVTAGINYQLNPNTSQYTYVVTDLMGFNTQYNTKYYYRMSKPYDNSTTVTIELVDGRTNTVKETKQISGTGTVTLGQSTLAPITGSKQAYIEFRFENTLDADKTNRPALRATWKFNGSANDFDGQRSAIQIYDVVNTANEGTTITDPQYYIPRLTKKTTYYKVVDKNAATYDPTRVVGNFVSNNSGYVMNSSTPGDYKLVNDNGTPEVSAQTYRATGSEESLGSFTLTGMEGQNFHASALRAFDGYKLYQAADSRSLVDVLKKPYEVGQRWFDVANAEGGVKRIKEVVGEDGTVRIEMWAIKSDRLNKISKDLKTEDYVKVYETVIRPGSNNKIDHPEDFGKNPEIDDAEWNKDNNKPVRSDLKPELRDKLVVGKPFAIFSDKQNTNYLGDLEYGKPNVADFIYKRPNGTFYRMAWGGNSANNSVEYTFTEVSATEAAGYQPRYSAAGEFYVNRGNSGAPYKINGTGVASGNVFRLENRLTPNYETVYYYVKGEPVSVIPEVEKQLEGRVLAAGEFTFKLKEEQTNPSIAAYEETVTNKADGKATFSKLTFTKTGTYKYKITEQKGSDTNVDYDAMTVTMTVTVTEKNAVGDLQASVKYSADGGFKSSADDKIFNNYVVAPVKTKFDFSKALAGRELKAGEFSFVLKDSTGKTLQTKTNTKEGVVAFDDLTFDNTQVGTHKYTVEEVQGSEAGMTYDPMKAEVTITVTKEGHVLKATNTLPADTEFNNTFTPSPVKVNLEFDKSLSNGTLNAGDFSFTLTGDNNVNETVTNKANGKINFSELSFDQVGVYNYTVKEVKGDKADVVDYDAMTIAVKVTVTKDADTGLLSATTAMTSSGGEATDANDRIFNNHVVAPVTAQFDFSKVLAGRQLTAGEFSFELVDPSDTSTDPNGKVLQTKTNDANGLVKFDALTFKNGQEGTHKYIVREVQGSLTGVTYDTMKAEVTVTVTKSGHALAAVTTLPTDTVFNNTYTPSPASAQFRFTKKLEGKTLQGDDFEFELLENGNVIQTKKNAADGSITFDAISYATEGVHTYTVREKAGNDTNIDYDAMNATVTVTVTKDATTGLLNAAVTLPTDTEFNNYVVPPVPVNVNFTKALAGRALVAGEFTFEMKDENGVVVATGTNDEHGVVTFNQLPEVTNAQVGKVIKYTVSEKVPANKEFGVTYDNMVAEVSVSVVKNATTHALQAVVTYPGGDTEFNNTVTPPTTPDFQPEKFIVNKEKYDITGTKLMDDDDELADEYTDTNANPYADGTANNEPENLNTKTVKKGDKIVYQVWLDTTNLKASDNIQAVGISDKYEADKLEINVADIKAYDSVTGVDVTDKFDITVNNGVITATSKASFIKDINNDPVIDTTLFEFGRYYKFDIPAKVKTTTPNGVDIENTANQIVHQYDPTHRNITKPEKPTQKRVVNLPVPLEFDFTKKLDGRNLVENEFTFVLKKDGVAIQTVKNSAPDATTGIAKIAFKPLEFTKADAGNTFTYTVEEVAGTDATVSYDNMVATIKVEVKHDGTTKTTVVNKLQDAPDKEFNNTVKPPEEPKFNPEKYVVDKEKFDITGDKLVDDDSELADKYGDTNANPYADGTANNEPENLNTKTVKPGTKLVYQVWLDTTQFSATNTENIQTLGITDNYDEDKLDVNSIKVYDSVTGADVTSKFDIANTGGVITATLKAGFTKSLGDANNTQIIDTTKFAFGRYYKVDIVTTVKTTVEPGKDIENTAGQIVHYYNPRTNKVEKPEKPTEKRVNNVPVPLEFDFTKKLDGRNLVENEFTFVLKKDGVAIQTVKNSAPDATTGIAKIAFKPLEFTKADAGNTFTYTVEEVAGTDATVSYDNMVATIKVEVKHDGTTKTTVVNMLQDAPDKEFNNTVKPPEEPKFNPEKYVVDKEKFDITGDKLVDDDSELADKYGDTNANPYADGTANNEPENLNTKTVKPGDKLVYQVWLDTKQFSATNTENIQTLGI
ncbi:Spy0128 family protein, partial [Streptococcus parasanguinis]|uniref:Spy0128 family protein n=2 Tax=Streptococcus parasanguinis TaxID=1318 RepID=UPI0039C49746